MSPRRVALASAAVCGWVALAACSPPPRSLAAGAAPAAPAEVAAAAAAAAPVTTPRSPAAANPRQRLRGAAIMGKDGYGVTLCGETTQRIVQLDEPARAMLDGFLANGAHEFRVDGWGDLPDSGHAHFASFERFDIEGRICDEALDGVAFRARGNEPFWSVEVTPASMSLERPDHAKLTGPTTSLAVTHDIVAYQAATPQGRLLVRFSPGICHDGMSEAQFAWRAEATLGTQKWSGCGYRGGERTSADPSR